MAIPLALQLYSVREQCAQDFPGTVKTVAEMGYRGVELAGLHGMAPADVAKMLADNGLELSSQHGKPPTAETLDECVAEQKALGCPLLVSGVGPDDMKTADAVRAAAERFETAAQLLKPHGIEVGYHNHWWEFELKIDGRPAHDLFMKLAPSVFAELDVYWCAFGGCDSVATVRQLGSRATLLHIKDGPLPEKMPHTAVGAGNLPMQPIIGAADPADVKWLIVELDSCATDMVEACRQSAQYLTGNGLAAGK